jgi:hypothetical protein
MDANGDGELDVDEIRGALQRNGGITVRRYGTPRALTYTPMIEWFSRR